MFRAILFYYTDNSKKSQEKTDRGAVGKIPHNQHNKIKSIAKSLLKTQSLFPQINRLDDTKPKQV